MNTSGATVAGLKIVLSVLIISIIETNLLIDFRDSRILGGVVEAHSGNTSRTMSELIIKSGTVTMSPARLVFRFFFIVNRSKTVAVFCH